MPPYCSTANDDELRAAIAKPFPLLRSHLSLCHICPCVTSVPKDASSCANRTDTALTPDFGGLCDWEPISRSRGVRCDGARERVPRSPPRRVTESWHSDCLAN